MDIQRQDLGDNISVVSVTLNGSDYKPKFDSEVNKQAQKSAVKGFRKGKTPPSFIKKMYGESLLADIVDKMLYEKLTNFLTENKIKTLAQPILSKETHIHLDVNDLDKDYTAKFEIGIIPDFEIKGIDEAYSYDYFTNSVSEEEVNKQIVMYAKNLGNFEDVEEALEEDTIYATAQQMEGGKVKEDGYQKDVVIAMMRLKNEDFKQAMLKKKKGDVFTAKITDLENGDLNFIKKYVLGLGEEVEINENDEVQLTINNIKRMVPVELTDELVNERFNVPTLGEFREIIKGNLNNNKEAAAKAMLQVKIKNKIMEETHVDLSEKFARKWLTEAEKLDEEKIEKEISNFMKDLKWNYISDELAKSYEISVTEQDLRSKIDATIVNYEMRNGRLSDADYKKVFQQIASDRDQMYKITDDIKTEKLFNVLVEKVNKTEIPITDEEFKLKIDELNKR